MVGRNSVFRQFWKFPAKAKKHSFDFRFVINALNLAELGLLGLLLNYFSDYFLSLVKLQIILASCGFMVCGFVCPPVRLSLLFTISQEHLNQSSLSLTRYASLLRDLDLTTDMERSYKNDTYNVNSIIMTLNTWLHDDEISLLYPYLNRIVTFSRELKFYLTYDHLNLNTNIAMVRNLVLGHYW